MKVNNWTKVKYDVPNEINDSSISWFKNISFFNDDWVNYVKTCWQRKDQIILAPELWLTNQFLYVKEL